MSTFQIHILSLGDQHTRLLKALRLVGDMDLYQARGLLDFLKTRDDSVLLAGVGEEVAEHVAGLLREAGASTRVAESSLDNPMLLSPNANRCYTWTWLGAKTLS